MSIMSASFSIDRFFAPFYTAQEKSDVAIHGGIHRGEPFHSSQNQEDS